MCVCVCVCVCVCSRADIVRIWKCLGVSRTGIIANQQASQKLKIFSEFPLQNSLGLGQQVFTQPSLALSTFTWLAPRHMFGTSYSTNQLVFHCLFWSPGRGKSLGQLSFCFTRLVQFSSVTQSHLTLWDPWTTARQASLSITNSRSLLKFMLIESMMPSNHLILYHPLLLPPSIFPSIRVFSNESVLRTKWPKYWSFSFSISPSNEHPGLISFRMDWLDLLAVQGTVNSLLQHHSSKASVLQHSAFFIPTLTSITWLLEKP